MVWNYFVGGDVHTVSILATVLSVLIMHERLVCRYYGCNL